MVRINCHGVMTSLKRLTREDWQKIVTNYDTFLFDADGVLWNANEAISGSIEAVSELRKLGKRVGLLTNNSTKSRKKYFEKCQNLGFHAFHMENIVTTAAVFANHLLERKFEGKVYVIGSKGIGDELDAIDIPYTGIGADHFDEFTSSDMLPEVPLDPKVRAVVVGFDGQFSYVKCMKAASYLKNPDCLWIATNADETLPSSNPKYTLPGTGSIVAAVAKASGRKPLILGKPHSPTFDYVKSLFGQIEPSKTLMIGDRCNTDIKFANDHGMVSMLVLTGVSDFQAVEAFKKAGRHDLVPQYFTDSIQDVLKMM